MTSYDQVLDLGHCFHFVFCCLKRQLGTKQIGVSRGNRWIFYLFLKGELRILGEFVYIYI